MLKANSAWKKYVTSFKIPLSLLNDSSDPDHTEVIRNEHVLSHH